MELKGKKINALGDSITEGVGVTSQDKLYFNIVKDKETLSLTRNYGRSGSRVACEAHEPGTSLVERYTIMDDDADIIVVFGGTNDYGFGTGMIGTMEDRYPDTFYGACHTLYKGLIEKYPLATIVIMTPVKRSWGVNPELIHPSRVNATLSDYRNVIKEVAEYYALPVLDLYALSGIDPNVEINKINYCPDGLHPNDLGHEVIASKLINFLKAL